jgi:hypothetical protein
MRDRLASYNNYAISQQMFDYAPMLASRTSPTTVRNRDGFDEIEYLVGDLRPGQTAETPTAFIIPCLGYEELEELDITLTAHAMNKSGVAKDRFSLTIERKGFPPESLVNPKY